MDKVLRYETACWVLDRQALSKGLPSVQEGLGPAAGSGLFAAGRGLWRCLGSRVCILALVYNLAALSVIVLYYIITVVQ